MKCLSTFSKNKISLPKLLCHFCFPTAEILDLCVWIQDSVGRSFQINPCGIPLLLAVLQGRSAEPSGTSKPHTCAPLLGYWDVIPWGTSWECRSALMWSLGSSRQSLDLFLYLLSLDFPPSELIPRQWRKWNCAAWFILLLSISERSSGMRLGVSIPLQRAAARVTPHPFPQPGCIPRVHRAAVDPWKWHLLCMELTSWANQRQGTELPSCSE